MPVVVVFHIIVVTVAGQAPVVVVVVATHGYTNTPGVEARAVSGN